MKTIVVGSWGDAKRFELDRPYAVISFTSTSHHRIAPKLKRSSSLVRRIIIRADDALPNIDLRGKSDKGALKPLDEGQARRIVSFVKRIAPDIDTLFIHCVFGEGRSPAAALSIAKAYGLPWQHYEREPYTPNPWIIELLDRALSNAQ